MNGLVPGALTESPAEASNQPATRIVIQSLGNAGMSVLSALGHFSPLPEAALAALLLQTPSELLAAVPRAQAEQIAGMLTEAGLEVELERSEVAFRPGTGDLETALVVTDVSRMARVMTEIAHILRARPERVVHMLFGNHVPFLGKVSANTVAALERRFRPLGVDVLSAPLDGSLFDVFLGPCSPMERRRVEDVLTGGGIPLLDLDGQSATPFVAGGITREQADRVWKNLNLLSAPVTLVNQAFERFELLLLEASDHAGFLEFLMQTTGMPEKVARKIADHVPIVTHINIGRGDMERHLQTLVQMGVRAQANLLSFQSFQLELQRAPDPAAAQRLLEKLGGIPAHEVQAALRKMPHRFPKTMTGPQSAWLIHELGQCGAVAGRLLR